MEKTMEMTKPRFDIKPFLNMSRWRSKDYKQETGAMYGITYRLNEEKIFMDEQSKSYLIGSFDSTLEEAGFTKNLCGKVYITDDLSNVAALKSYIEENSYWRKYVDEVYLFRIQDLTSLLPGDDNV